MLQTRYALAVPKNLGLGLNFRLCSEAYSQRAQAGCYPKKKDQWKTLQIQKI